MPYLETADGGRVHYEHFAGRNAPVVLIHGWGMSGRVWYSIVEGLCRAGHEVVTVDQRGCGRSDRDFADLSIAANARDVQAIAAALKLRPAILNGWSLGGAIAAEAAQRMGDTACGLVLTCGATPRLTRAADFPYGAEPGSYAALGDALLADRAGFFQGIAQGTCAKDVGAATIAWLQAIFLESGPMLYTALAAAEDLDQRALLAGLEIPVLAVIGGRDAILAPELGSQAVACTRRGAAALFPESGHAPFLEEPEAYLAELLRFTASCP